MRSRCGTDQDISFAQEIALFIETEHFNSVRIGQFVGFLFRTVGQEHHFGTLVFQEFDDVFRQLVYPDNGDVRILQVDVLTLNHLDGCQTVTDGSLRDLCLGANSLTYLKCTLKKLVQSGRQFLTTVTGCHIGLFHLSLYGTLAYDGTLQSADHTEQMACH